MSRYKTTDRSFFPFFFVFLFRQTFFISNLLEVCVRKLCGINRWNCSLAPIAMSITSCVALFDFELISYNSVFQIFFQHIYFIRFCLINEHRAVIKHFPYPLIVSLFCFSFINQFFSVK